MCYMPPAYSVKAPFTALSMHLIQHKLRNIQNTRQ
jgi:hypothetical protein